MNYRRIVKTEQIFMFVFRMTSRSFNNRVACNHEMDPFNHRSNGRYQPGLYF